MTKPVTARVSSPCMRGRHDGCMAFGACECHCHTADAPEPPPESPTLVVVPEPIAVSAPPVDEAGDGGAWEDPPSRKKPCIPPAERALIDAHPGRWRMVRAYKGDSACGARIRLLRSGEVAGPYEVKAARVGGQSKLYVRRKAEE